MADVGDVVNTLDGVPHLIDRARACLWGAEQATAPKDRWQQADDHLAAAMAAIQLARGQLAAVEKREAYCTTCSVPLLSLMPGWRHWDGTDSYDAGHQPVLDWRRLAEGN